MAVANQLTGLFSGRSVTSSVNDVVKAALQNAEQVFTSHAGFALSHIEVLGKLAFQNAVVAFGSLFCAQLGAVLGNFFPGFAVLARDRSSAGDRALIGIASLALEEQLFALAAAESAYRTGISCH